METNPKSLTLVMVSKELIVPLTHVPDLECYIEEEFVSKLALWQSLDIGNAFGPTVGLINS